MESQLKILISQQYRVRGSHELASGDEELREHRHGHEYCFTVTVKGNIDPISQTCKERKILKFEIENYFNSLDQTDLSYQFKPSTGEVICYQVFSELSKKFPQLQLFSVALKETEKNDFIYHP